MDTTVSFDQLPQLVKEMHEMISDLCERQTQLLPEEDRLMSVDEYREYVYRRTGKRPARQTVYDQVYKGQLPNERHGKYLYFRRSIIDAFYNNGRQVR